MAACPRCGLAAVEGARFCFACGSRCRAPGGGPARKTVTVVFADVNGFTALGERLDPEALAARDDPLLRRDARGSSSATAARSRSSSATRSWRVFGVPALHEDDVVRAARAALEMRTALETSTATSRDAGTSGSSPTRGSTRARSPSHAPEGEALTLGDPVNVAQRLERRGGRARSSSARSPSGCCAGARASSRSSRMRLKGKSDLVAGWRLVGLDAGAGGGAAQLARGPRRPSSPRCATRSSSVHRDPDARRS